MKQVVGLKAAVAVLGALASLCYAQDTKPAREPAKFFKLDFVVRDLDGGKVVSARNYSMIASTEGPANQMRAGSHVQIVTAKHDGMNQYSGFDVGTSIDCSSLEQLHDDLSFHLTAELSNLLQEQPDSYPIVRQNKWSSHVIIPLKKPTVVFSSDDSSTKRVLQLEVTATPR